jgi:hypothetical protein
MNIGMKGNEVVLQVGQEMHYYAHNDTNAPSPNYPYKTGLDFEFISKSAGCKVSSSIKAMSFINDIGF